MVQVARTRPTFINNMDVSSAADTVTNIGSPGMQAYTSANTEPGATCPTGAISFVEREAAAYDEKAVQENMRKKLCSPAVA